jgi:putative transposase
MGTPRSAFSPSQVPMVRAYIENQERHHVRPTFEQELVALLEKSGVEYERKHLT